VFNRLVGVEVVRVAVPGFL